MTPLDPDQAVRLVRLFLGLAICLSSLELLALAPEMAGRGVWAPPDGRSEPPLLWRGVIALRLAAGLALLALPGPALVLPAALTAFATSFAVLLRLRWGLEGADQMQTVLSAALAIAAAVPEPQVTRAFLGFAALLAVSAYATAGWMKLVMAGWRDGSLLAGILRTRQFGHPLFARVIAPGPGAGLAAALVIGFESSFPLALVLGPEVAVGFCAAAFLFHLSCAFAMGLNVFPWAFAATYPAVVWCAGEVQRLLG